MAVSEANLIDAHWLPAIDGQAPGLRQTDAPQAQGGLKPD